MAVLTLIGETGTGKSRWTRETFPDAFYLPFAKSSGTYWDGYEGQSCVVIEEANGGRFSYNQLLSLLDRYPFQVSIHGGQCQFTSRVIVFTSNHHPNDWYDAHKFPYYGHPLERRMTTGLSRVIRVDAGMQLVCLEGAPLEDGWIDLIKATIPLNPIPLEGGDDNNNNNEAVE